MKKGKVIQDYQAQYADPIAVKKGENIILGQRDSEWPGWVWCTDNRGKSGWTPESYIAFTWPVELEFPNSLLYSELIFARMSSSRLFDKINLP